MSLTSAQKTGGAFAIAAYTLWGLAPLYFKQLAAIPAQEILVHRIIWSVLLLALLISGMRQWRQIAAVLQQPKLVLAMFGTALLLSVNWGLFIWAINNNHMLDTSLGYYINPLFNILLGMLFLGERLRPLQWTAVGLATGGVLLQVIQLGSLPWVALALASSFAFYGLLRKKLPADAIGGLFVESLLLAPLALWYWWQFADSPYVNLAQNSWSMNLWLMAAGIVTTVPLLCFIAAARRLQLSTMGFFQYIGPSMTFLFGVFLYHEPLDQARLMTFGCIWLALAIYSADAWRHLQRAKRAVGG